MVARRMAHPKDRSGLTRRQLLQGAAGTVVGAGALGLVAGCENTTTPLGGGTGESNKFVESKPTGPKGLPLPPPDNSVTWAITADNPMVLEGGARAVALSGRSAWTRRTC